MLIKTHDEEKSKLSSYIPWICLIDKGIVLNKNGTLQKTLKYRGHDLDSSTDAEMLNITARLNNVLKRLDGGWSFNIEARRKKVNDYKLPETEILALEIVEKERKENFIKSIHLESEYYLTLVYLIEADTDKKVNNFFLEYAEKTEILDKTLEKFKKEFKQIYNLFNEILLEVKELDDEETYTYLHSCVSVKDNKIRVPEIPYAMSNYLCDCDLVAGLKPKLKNKEFRIITLQGFPNYTTPGFFDILNRLNIEYRWITRFICLSKLEALSIIEKKYKALFSQRFTMGQRVIEQITGVPTDLRKANLDAVEKSDSVLRQKKYVEGDYLSQGYYNCNIILYGDSDQEVEEKVELIVKKIDSMGFVTIVESINSIQAFLGSVPGNISNNLRKPILNSITLSHLLPISSVWGGQEKNKHLNDLPLIYTKTKGSTPFKFNLHVGDIGHTAIVGPTGSGKSVFLGLIALSFLKYKNAKVFFFDKDASSRVLTYCVGGNFYDLGKDSLSFQPLLEIGVLQKNLQNGKTLEEEKERANIEKEWALGWFLEIFAQENVNITPLQKEKLWIALDNLSLAPENQRTLSNFYTILNDRDLQEALSSYKIPGALGKYFDSDDESLAFSNWQVFEMNEIINNKMAVTPLLSYLFRKIENSLDGSPTIIILDECWMFFDNEQFSSKIRDWLKTLRKKNASVIFATQELGDIMNSKLFTTILDACKTKVFLPNANAGMDNYMPIYRKFGLNNTEISIIANGTPKKEYYYKSPLGSRKFDLDLQKNTLKIIASSDVESQNKAIELNKLCKTDRFVKAWLGD